MTEHTPTPWRINPDNPFEFGSDNYGGIGLVYNEPAEVMELMDEQKANARFIVKCVNEREGMLQLLFELEYANVTNENVMGECPICTASREQGHFENCKLQAVLAKAQEDK